MNKNVNFLIENKLLFGDENTMKIKINAVIVEIIFFV